MNTTADRTIALDRGLRAAVAFEARERRAGIVGARQRMMWAMRAIPRAQSYATAPTALIQRRQRTGHATARDALVALARVMPIPGGITADDLVTVKADDGTCVYISEEARDRDDDGSSASAVIVCEQTDEYEQELDE